MPAYRAATAQDLQALVTSQQQQLSALQAARRSSADAEASGTDTESRYAAGTPTQLGHAYRVHKTCTCWTFESKQLPHNAALLVWACSLLAAFSFQANPKQILQQDACSVVCQPFWERVSPRSG